MDHSGPVTLCGLRLSSVVSDHGPGSQGEAGQGGEGAEHLAAFPSSGPGPHANNPWLPSVLPV